MRVDCIIGPVGSGKTTLFGLYDQEKWVRFSSGHLCRSAVGIGLFSAGDRPNAPEIVDGFVFASLEAHLDLALKMGRPLVAEYPRTRAQAEKFLHRLLYRYRLTDLHILVHRLHVCESTWEQRMRTGRWIEHPEQEKMDRARFSASVQDAIEATAYLRHEGSVLTTVREWREDTTPEQRKPIQ